VVDQQSQTVEVVRSDNFKVLGRLGGFQDPRDVSISTNTSQSATTLYVSNFGSNQLVAVDLEGIAVSFTGQPGAPSPCAAIKDNQKNRAFIGVGSGPTEVSADCYLQQRAMVCNTLDSSVSLIDVRQNTVLKTLQVGSNPVCCDWNVIQFGALRVAIIVNQGGLNDPAGSASLYLKAPPLSGIYITGQGQQRDGIETTLTDGIRNPTHVWGNQKWIDPPPPAGTLTSAPIEWYVSNTGGTTSVQLLISTQGSIFGLSITPAINQTLQVGLNPTSTILDPFYPDVFAFVSVMGTGSVMAVDPSRSIPPVAISVSGVRRLYSCFTN
jgi:DNA-binding beta-propeller fold protein YncE